MFESNFRSTYSLTLVLLVTSGLVYACRYIFNVFLAGHIEAHLYGDFSLALQVVFVVGSIALLGTNVSATRFLASYISEDQKERIHHFIAWTIQLVRVPFILCLIAGALTLALISTLHFLKLYDLSKHHIVVFMLWVAPTAAISILLGSFLLCSNRPILSFILVNAGPIVLMLGLLAVTTTQTDIQITEINLSFIIFFAFFILAVYETILLTRNLPGFLGYLQLKEEQVESPLKSEWLKTSKRMIVNKTMVLIAASLDLIIIELLVPNESAVGHYAAIITISGIIWLIPKGGLQIIKPKISTLTKTPDGKSLLQNHLNVANVLIVAACLLITTYIVVFAETLLGHFGEGFKVAKTPLLIVAISSFFGAISRVSASLLAFSGRELLLNYVNYIDLAIMLIAGAIFTYFWGILGTAISFAIAVSAKSIVSIWLVRRSLKVRSLIFV